MKEMQEQYNRQVPPKRRKKKNLFLVTLYSILIIFLVAAVAVLGVGAGIVSAYTKNEKIRTKKDFDEDLNGWSETSYAYFRDATTGKPKLIGAMNNEKDRVLVRKPSDVSPNLLNALFSTEDRQFYTHDGVVPTAVLRAAFQQAIGSKVVTGGSTLTQQLVKNEILGNRERSLERKSLEIVNALRLEKFYKKDEILVKYLNSVYFFKGANGKHMYGVMAAARGLFNKDAKDLTLPEAAYIAGMVQQPIKYNPFSNDPEIQKTKIKRGMKRMKMVLDYMVANGKITPAQRDEAAKYDITKSLAKPSDFKNAYETYPFIISAVESEAIKVLQELDKKYHPEEAKDRPYKYYSDKVRGGGLKIYSTVDQALYESMNKSVKNIDFPRRKINGVLVREQIGSVMIENKTGSVLSFFAGTDFEENQKDHAFDAQNQPGSSMKPLLAYGPAINEGVISPNSIIVDEPIKKENSSIYYKNDGGNFHGAVTATKALQFSYNIPAIKVFRATENKLGSRQKVFDYIRAIGMSPDKKDRESLVLGGATYGYTVEQMTGGYAMIANGGKFNKPHLISKITDSQGHVIYDYAKENAPKQVFTPQTAYQLTGMLKQVVRSGTAEGFIGQISGYNIAGKTGTTSNQYDLWFVGYTPEVSMGVWSGYDYNKKGDHDLAKTAWVKLFKAAAATNPTLIRKGSDFQDPGGSLGNKCFECNRQAPEQPETDANQGNPKEEQKKKDKKQKNKKEQQPNKNTGIVPPNHTKDQKHEESSNNGSNNAPTDGNGLFSNKPNKSEENQSE
ncbi:penicillin-binding protein [Shimazuella sp. AN120528]|uniref:transglycosylase domain-containing protein n=1 Tax=Shimazuella soli TaxID=1892854 RepID=UPI001F0D481A|nr:transglycosylase domain-containing protein [Shimazuella soli]MCH5583551.1 penicillin-binding protein [Shimazuella soli]